MEIQLKLKNKFDPLSVLIALTVLGIDLDLVVDDLELAMEVLIADMNDGIILIREDGISFLNLVLDTPVESDQFEKDDHLVQLLAVVVARYLQKLSSLVKEVD